MTVIVYQQSAPVVVGRQKTITIRVKGTDGDWLSLDGKTLLAKAQAGTATPITPNFTKADPQSGKTKGRATMTITAAQVTTGAAGNWKIRLFVGESSGTEEFLWDAAFTFDAEAALA